MGAWSLIVEGANTYSPDPNRKAAHTAWSRWSIIQKGVMIATDYLVNSGGVIFAAQELALPTPPELQIPSGIHGSRKDVDRWLRTTRRISPPCPKNAWRPASPTAKR